MISQRIRGLNSLFVFSQLTLVLFVYWLHFLVIDLLYAPVPDVKRYEIYCIVMYVALVIEAFRRLNKDSKFLQKSRLKNQRIALEQTLFVAVVLIIYLVVTKDQGMSRLFLFSFLPVLFVLLYVSSCYLPPLLAHATFRGIRQERTLLVGPGDRIAVLKNWLIRKADLGILTIGLLTDEEAAGSVEGIRVLGGTDDLERVVREYDVAQVIIVEFPMFPHIIQSLINSCEQLGVRLLVLSDLEARFRHPITYFDDDGLLFFGLREEPLENPFNRLLKRTMDIVLSVLVLVLVVPIMTALVALFQLLQSPGPLLHSQLRAGLQNRRFKILKFRTMRANPDLGQQAMANDERVYPAARFFRRFSLDELPQFWNVLHGEMSVVGPRPHLIEHNHEFATVMNNYHVRAFVKPGITGLAQVRGYRGEMRSEGDLIGRIRLDIHYLEHWSLGLDLAIIVQTAWQMIFPPKSAY